MKSWTATTLVGLGLVMGSGGVLRAQPQPADARPSLAVLPFDDRSGNEGSWWGDWGADATQDAFVTGLSGDRRFRVIDRDRLDALTEEHGVSPTRTGHIDRSAARLLGVEYFLVGAVTEYGRTGESFVAAANARIIDAQTGEILWADEARVSIGGFGGGDRGSRFDKVMKPIVHELTASIKSADL